MTGYEKSPDYNGRRSGTTAIIVLLVCALALIASIGHLFARDPIVGRASVVDGDTIDIGKVRIRFNGIDAPESSQRCKDGTGKEYRCGAVAAGALDAWLANSRPTRCDFVNRDRYKRVVANCFRADGASVASWLVSNGHALDWPRYSKGAFASEQVRAKRKKAGIWQGEFTAPWDVRKKGRK